MNYSKLQSRSATTADQVMPDRRSKYYAKLMASNPSPTTDCNDQVFRVRQRALWTTEGISAEVMLRTSEEFSESIIMLYGSGVDMGKSGRLRFLGQLVLFSSVFPIHAKFAISSVFDIHTKVAILRYVAIEGVCSDHPCMLRGDGFQTKYKHNHCHERSASTLFTNAEPNLVPFNTASEFVEIRPPSHSKLWLVL